MTFAPKLPHNHSFVVVDDCRATSRRRVLFALMAGAGTARVYASASNGSFNLPWQQQVATGPSTQSVLGGATILEDGWRVTGTLPGLAPNGLAPKSGWGDLPKQAVLRVSGPGWDSNARFNPMQARTIPCNSGVKRMWQLGVATPDTVAVAPFVLDAAGNNLKVEFAATNFIYGREVVDLTATTGWFQGAAPVASARLHNYSMLSFGKAMIDWVEPTREHVTEAFIVCLTGGFHVEGRNGSPLAAVRITGTLWDPLTNLPRPNAAPVARAATYQWSGEYRKPGQGSAVWAASFDPTDFLGGGLVRFTFEDFPWVGDETAQRCSELVPSVDPRTTALAFQSPQNSVAYGIHGIFKWVGPLPRPRHVYVAAPDSKFGSVGNDGLSACQTSMDDAKRSPFRSFDAAWLALFDPARGGSSDASGAVVWLSDGTHRLPVIGVSNTRLLRSATDAPITIRSDPAAVESNLNCVVASTGTTRYLLFNHGSSIKTSFAIARKLSLQTGPACTGIFGGSGATRPTFLHFDDCVVDERSGSFEQIFGSGTIVSARSTFFKSSSKISYLDQVNTNYICTFFHNCRSEISLRGNVVWGAAYPATFTGAPILLGAGLTSFIRCTNLVAGYAYAPDWQPPDNAFRTFVGRAGTATGQDDDFGISVAYCRTAGERFNNTRFVKMGETVSSNYRNFVVEGVTMTRQAVAGVPNSGGGGFNFHNDPRTVPVQPPGNDYDRCVVRNSSLARMAVKGDVFYSRKNAVAATLLTGGRAARHGVGMHGLIVGTCATANALNLNGLCSVWGNSETEYSMAFVDEANLDFRPRAGFVPLPPELLGHSFDLNGDKLYLDGSDAPGAFRRFVG